MDTYIYMLPCFIVCYFVGSLSPAILIGKIFKKDIMSEGSGNAGTTNVLRTLGVVPAVCVFALDVAKGFFGVFLSALIINSITNYDVLAQICGYGGGVGIVYGHVFSCFHHFKAGKGVASSIGVAFAVNWMLGLACATIMLLAALTTRMISVGSILVAVAIFVFACIFEPIFYPYSIAISVIVLVKHAGNMNRIIHGKERKLFQK